MESYNKLMVGKYGVSSYEELTAFQHTDNEAVFQKSMEAWNLLANQFVDGAFDYNFIVEEFRRQRNTRELKYHKDAIQNYKPFFQELRKAGLGKYIRVLMLVLD
eukprot:3723665-Ditylum_brightwellii.AAC.1